MERACRGVPVGTGWCSSKVHLLDSAWRHGPVTALVADDGLVWTGTSRSGVVVHDTRVGLGAYLPQDAAQGAGTRVYGLLLAADGAVWSTDGSKAGQACGSVCSMCRVTRSGSTRITALCGDREGRIWFATGRVFNHRAAFADDLTLTRTTITVDETTRWSPLAVDTHGQLWAATFGAGLLRLGTDGALVRMDEQEPASTTMCFPSVNGTARSGWPRWTGFVCRDPGQAGPGLEHVTLPGTGFVYDVLPMPDGSVLAATDGSGSSIAHQRVGPRTCRPRRTAAPTTRWHWTVRVRHGRAGRAAVSARSMACR